MLIAWPNSVVSYSKSSSSIPRSCRIDCHSRDRNCVDWHGFRCAANTRTSLSDCCPTPANLTLSLCSRNCESSNGNGTGSFLCCDSYSACVSCCIEMIGNRDITADTRFDVCLDTCRASSALWYPRNSFTALPSTPKSCVQWPRQTPPRIDRPLNYRPLETWQLVNGHRLRPPPTISDAPSRVPPRSGPPGSVRIISFS